MSNHSKFPSRLRHIQKNDPVTAGIASSPDKTLEGRTNYLKDRLDEIEAGRALIWAEQVVKSDVLVGQPVYFNTETQQWEQALAGVVECGESAGLDTIPSSNCNGMLLTKNVGNTGDIALWGVVHFEDQLSNAIDGSPITPGTYYLSATEPGKLVLQRPPVSVVVCEVFGPLDECDDNTWVYVRPNVKDFLNDHIHYCYELVARPAGDTTPPACGDIHTIIDPDSTQQGWLPADDAIFGGFAPTGAVFGYNLSEHEAVDRNWPPIPPEASVLEQFKPLNPAYDQPDCTEYVKRPQVGGALPKSTVIIDRHGIWWMTNCYDSVPWPTDLNTTLSSSSVSSSSVSSSSSSAGDDCPEDEVMTLKLYFLKMTFLGQKTVVTSLQPDDGQPLRYVNCDGDEANTGELFAQLLLAFLIEDEFLGGQVLKGITEDNKFERGWAVEGAIAGVNVSLSSTHTRLLDPTLPASPTNPTVYQELVTINSSLDPVERELNPQIVVLGDALEREYKDIQYLGLKEGRTSGIRMKFMVPPDGLPAVPRLIVRLQLFGRSDGNLTDLDTDFKILVRPDGITTPTPIVAGNTALVLDTAITVLADNIYEVESDPITIEPGDTVYVTIERSVSGTPAYPAEIGLHRYGGVIVDGS